jgi:hypothetical protein
MVVLVACLLLVFVMARMHTAVWNGHEVALGRVLETRIAVSPNRNGSDGKTILYRIEANVRYSLHGQLQKRWMPASQVTTDRDILAMRLVKQPQTCTVYWASNQQENPNCVLPAPMRP